MKNSISKIFLTIGITCLLSSCAKKNVSDLNQNERFIEGKIVDSYGLEVSNAEIYFPESDEVHHTDETGYFKIILPKGYKVKYLLIVDRYTDASTKFSLQVFENQMNNLKLDDFYRITKSKFDLPEPFCGLPINQDVVKFQVVYEYAFDAPSKLDESWFKDYGKPVQNAIIKIVGTENIYTSNENGEIWIEKNEIKIGDVLIVEDEMGTQSQVNITSQILSDKIIRY